MIFRQLFDSTSSTYSYLLASRPGGEALTSTRCWKRSTATYSSSRSSTCGWVKAIETHLHADHITG